MEYTTSPFIKLWNIPQKFYELETGAKPLRYDDYEPKEDIKYLMKQNKYISKEDYEPHECKDYKKCDKYDYPRLCFLPRKYDMFIPEEQRTEIIQQDAHNKWKNGSSDTFRNWIEAEDNFFYNQSRQFYEQHIPFYYLPNSHETTHTFEIKNKVFAISDRLNIGSACKIKGFLLHDDNVENHTITITLPSYEPIRYSEKSSIGSNILTEIPFSFLTKKNLDKCKMINNEYYVEINHDYFFEHPLYLYLLKYSILELRTSYEKPIKIILESVESVDVAQFKSEVITKVRMLKTQYSNDFHAYHLNYYISGVYVDAPENEITDISDVDIKIGYDKYNKKINLIKSSKDNMTYLSFCSNDDTWDYEDTCPNFSRLETSEKILIKCRNNTKVYIPMYNKLVYVDYKVGLIYSE